MLTGEYCVFSKVFVVRGKSWIYLQALETGLNIVCMKKKLGI
jgi:hypothetical protein